MIGPSPSEIFAARTERGGWSKETLAQWGVAWPPPKGWIDVLKDRWRVEARKEAQQRCIVDYASNLITWTKSAGGDRWACCPIHGENTPSFHVRKSTQRWRCFGCGAGGDILDLCMALEGLKHDEALKSLLGQSASAPVAHARKPAQRDADEEAAKARRIGQARETWDAGRPIWGTVVETYLRERRGIGADLSAADLRINPKVRVWNEKEKRFHLAMVAAVRNAAGEIVAVHCTYLSDDAQKVVAIGDGGRLTRGTIGGGYIRLGEIGPRVVIAEGVESALSAGEISGRPALAAINSGNMGRLPLLDGVRDYLLAYDLDPNESGIKGAREFARRALPTGVALRAFPPPADHGVRDWNDVAQRRRM